MPVRNEAHANLKSEDLCRFVFAKAFELRYKLLHV